MCGILAKTYKVGATGESHLGPIYMEVGTPGSRVTRYPETLLSRVYMKTLRQDNPGTRVTFVSIMADPRTVVT